MRRAMKVLAEKWAERIYRDHGLVWSGNRKQLHRKFSDLFRSLYPPSASPASRRSEGSAGRSDAGKSVAP